jgi:hypothetical protein
MKAAKGKDISKGKEKEVISQVTASETEKKKHYVAKFVRLMKTSCVRHANMMEIQEEIFATMVIDKKPIIRPLWPKINLRYDSPNFAMNSSQTYFVDVNVDDNELTRLHGEVSKVLKAIKKACLLQELFQATLSGLKVDLDGRITENSLIHDMQVRLKTLEDDVLWKVDFIRKGTEVSLRAFMDYVLQCTFQREGLDSSNSNTWCEVYYPGTAPNGCGVLLQSNFFHKKLQLSFSVKLLSLTLAFWTCCENLRPLLLY